MAAPDRRGTPSPLTRQTAAVLSSRVAATAIGLAVLMLCGIAVAFGAAIVLPAEDYTRFAAFAGVLGMLVLGPANALEQEAAMRAARGRTSSGVVSTMLLRAATLWALVSAVVLLTPDAWAERLVGNHETPARLALVLGAPVVFATTTLRGAALAGGAYRLAGSIHAVAGAGMLAAPLGLRAAGVSWLGALIAGAVAAWLPACILAGAAVRRPTATSAETAHPGVYAAGASLQLGNLLVLVNLLVPAAVLRWHVTALDAVEVADVQILQNVSRLSATAVVGFLPLLMSSLASQRTPAAAMLAPAALAAVLGVATCVVCTALASPVVEVLTGRDSAVPASVNFLATLPMALLCPAIVLTAAAVAGRRYAHPLTGWTLGLLALLALTGWEPDNRLWLLLLGLVGAAAIPLLTLILTLVRRTPLSAAGD